MSVPLVCPRRTFTDEHLERGGPDGNLRLRICQPLQDGEPVPFEDLNPNTHCRGFLSVDKAEVEALLANPPNEQEHFELSRALRKYSAAAANLVDAKDPQRVLLPASGTRRGVLHIMDGIDESGDGGVVQSILSERERRKGGPAAADNNAAGPSAEPQEVFAPGSQNEDGDDAPSSINPPICPSPSQGEVAAAILGTAPHLLTVPSHMPAGSGGTVTSLLRQIRAAEARAAAAKPSMTEDMSAESSSVAAAPGPSSPPPSAQPTGLTTLESFLTSTRVFSVEKYRQARAKMVVGWSDEAFLISHVLPVLVAGSIDDVLSRWQAVLEETPTLADLKPRVTKLRNTWNNVCESPSHFCKGRLFPVLVVDEAEVLQQLLERQLRFNESLDLLKEQLENAHKIAIECRDNFKKRAIPNTQLEAAAYFESHQADLTRTGLATEALRDKIVALKKSMHPSDNNAAALDSMLNYTANIQQSLPQIPTSLASAASPSPTASSDSSSSSSAKSTDTTIKMYLLVNSDLTGMKAGKTAGQVGHAVAGLSRLLERNENGRFSAAQLETYNEWVENNEAKIILRATEAQMTDLHARFSEQSVAIYDLGKTQIPADSFTVLGFIPLKPADVPEEIRTMKLLY
jgi:peptidyl-tRNA hydrolase